MLEILITMTGVFFPSVIFAAGPGIPGPGGELHLEVVALLAALSLQLFQGFVQPQATVPGVAVLCYPAHNHQRFQHIHDVINAPSLHP